MPKHNQIADMMTAMIKPISIGVVVGFIIKYVFNKVSSLGVTKDQSLLQAKQTLGKIKTESISGANITQSQASVSANQLLQAFNYITTIGLMGTDEDTIFSILNPEYNTQARELLYAEFGFHPYYSTGTPAWYNSWFATDYDLSGWANQELSGSDLDQVRQYFANTKVAF